MKNDLTEKRLPAGIPILPRRIHDNQTELCAVGQRPRDPTNQRISMEAVRTPADESKGDEDSVMPVE